MFLKENGVPHFPSIKSIQEHKEGREGIDETFLNSFRNVGNECVCNVDMVLTARHIFPSIFDGR